MRPVGLPQTEGPLRVAFFGAHADDIEIGCYGALDALRRTGRSVEIRWVVLSGGEERRGEAERSAAALLEALRARVELGDLEDGYFPARWEAAKRWMARIRDDFPADLVFTHHRDDRHQDHRTTAELTWNLFRDALILEYEVPKYDGELGAPNAFVPMSDEVCQRKAEHLLRFFPSQADRPWFTAETFRGLGRVRGLEAGVAPDSAEAFHARKILLGA